MSSPLLAPIPPATITFRAAAKVHPAGSPGALARAKQLAGLLPPEGHDSACILEVIPDGEFVTYGLGVSLLQMRDPAIARVPVM